jgi:hypothetical protein
MSSTMDDAAVVEVQIGRKPRSAVVVSARCHLGLPVVTDVPPILDDGTPFPTTHWLTCPLAVTRISRLEAEGGVKAAAAKLSEDPEAAAAFAAASERYAAVRGSLIPEGWDGPVPTGGVAGSKGGVKCLHAQYADTAAGNANPIGEMVAEQIEPLGCTVGCVVDASPGPISNPAWVEPA